MACLPMCARRLNLEIVMCTNSGEFLVVFSTVDQVISG